MIKISNEKHGMGPILQPPWLMGVNLGQVSSQSVHAQIVRKLVPN